MDCILPKGQISTHKIKTDYFDDDTFQSILPLIAKVTCPVSYELIITEIQTQMESRFIELYNPSIYVNLSNIAVKGLFTATPISNTLGLEKGQYLVLYDGDAIEKGTNPQDVIYIK